MACLIANRKYGKNGRREDVKTHHIWRHPPKRMLIYLCTARTAGHTKYIISFAPKDAVENGLTMERAQADLNQINLLEAQGDHVSEREYWAQRRGQRRLDHANAKLAAEGQQPTQTVYQTELDKLRKQIYAVLNKTTTFEEFSALLMQEHGIAVKESRGRLSYCPPGRTKFITSRQLFA